MNARENLEVALSVISRPIPTSYYGIVTGLLWSLFSHLLFQVCLCVCLSVCVCACVSVRVCLCLSVHVAI